jgi:hypothetical protein
MPLQDLDVAALRFDDDIRGDAARIDDRGHTTACVLKIESRPIAAGVCRHHDDPVAR